jgi:hypothetical protein
VHRATRVSMHHNLFVNGQNRNPQAQWDNSLETIPPDTMLDFRNNLVWNFSAYGTLIRRNGTANVVSNYYRGSTQRAADHPLVVDRQGRAYAAGNQSSNGVNVDARGTETAAFASEPVAVTDACRAAVDIVDGVGARGPSFGLDALDSRQVGEVAAVISGGGCGHARESRQFSTQGRSE